MTAGDLKRGRAADGLVGQRLVSVMTASVSIAPSGSQSLDGWAGPGSRKICTMKTMTGEFLKFYSNLSKSQSGLVYDHYGIETCAIFHRDK